MALGSCVAVVVHDPVSRVTGMAHVALPSCGGENSRDLWPGYYADTAIPRLVRELERVRGGRVGGRLSVKLVGGASIVGGLSGMNIGKRNVLGVRRALKSAGLRAMVEEVGGSVSRTVRVRVLDAQTTVTTPEREERVL